MSTTVCRRFGDLDVKIIYKPIRHTYLRVKPGGEIQITTSAQASEKYIDGLLTKFYANLIAKRAKLAAKQSTARPAPLSQAEQQYAIKRVIQVFQQRFKYFADLGIAEPRLAWQLMCSRWGSYSRHSHRIKLNLALLYLEDKLIDYVVVHELCHLVELNHSPHFYALVSKFLPDWRRLRNELNTFSLITYQ